MTAGAAPQAKSSAPLAAGSATVVTVSPEADARVEQANPTTNFGSSYLRTDGGGDPEVDSYLRFNVSGLAGGIESATLRLHATTDTVDGPALYPAANDWGEGTVNWDNRPPRLGGAIADSGAVAPGSWVDYDVTSLVAGNGTYSFRLATNSDDGVNFNPREGGMFAPQLVIDTGDTTAPTAPNGVIDTGATETSISLSWNPSSDDVGVAGYGLYVDGNSVGTETGTSHTFAALACGTSYSLGIDAFDAAGNHSSQASLIAATAPCGDTEPPTAPSGLTAVAPDSGHVTLAWLPSRDNVGVSSYIVYRNSTRIASVATPGYVDATVAAGTTYVFSVKARDAAGNLSAASNSASVTTPPASTSLGSALPARLPESTGTTYYVAPSGSDSNPGTLAQPWRTVQHAADTLRPGGVAKIAPGTYAEDVVVSHACAATCTLEALDPGNRPVLNSIRVAGASFWRIRNLVFDGRVLGGQEYAAKVTCGNCSSSSGPGAHDIEFYGDLFEYVNLDYMSQGYIQTTQVYDIQLYNNQSRYNGSAFPGTNHSHGYYLQNGSMCVFANNIADHNESKGFQIYNGGTTESLHGSLIVNNLAYANGRMGFRIGNDSSAIGSADMVGGNQIRNNLSVGNGRNGGQGYDSQFTGMGGPSASPNTLDTNLAWANAGGDLYNGDGSLTSTTVGNLLHADPLFVDPLGGNFQLQPGSPAVGVARPAYTPPFDFTGKPRSVADLGPF